MAVLTDMNDRMIMKSAESVVGTGTGHDAVPERLTMDVAIPTHRPEGIARIASMRLPGIEGVRYIISWQSHEGVPVPEEIASRPDIEIYRLDEPGVARNRNNALDHCRADIVLHGDDDVIYTAGGLEEVRRVMAAHPQVDMATFRADMPTRRVLPSVSVRLENPLPRGYHVGTIEIAVRRSRAGWLRFCPELGNGAGRYEIGEDTMYLHTAIQRGLECRYFPVTICAHPHTTTGGGHFTPGHLRGTGCCIALTYPLTAILRVPLKAWRLYRAGQSGLWRALFYLTAGMLGAPGVKRRNPGTA